MLLMASVTDGVDVADGKCHCRTVSLVCRTEPRHLHLLHLLYPNYCDWSGHGSARVCVRVRLQMFLPALAQHSTSVCHSYGHVSIAYVSHGATVPVHGRRPRVFFKQPHIVCTCSIGSTEELQGPST